MRIVLFTKQGFESQELFKYIYANVVSEFDDVYIIAVKQKKNKNILSKLHRVKKKIEILGILGLLEVITSIPISIYFNKKNDKIISNLFNKLESPNISIKAEQAIYVESVNGKSAEKAIFNLKPDILIQAGAGILKKNIFTIPKICTLNIHHGIAPLIKGMSSINWALLENIQEWIGATLHEIDEGIDTGKVLAYAPIEQLTPYEGYPSLFVRATEKITKELIVALHRLNTGERWELQIPESQHIYKSTFSGWRFLFLEIKLYLRKIHCRNK